MTQSQTVSELIRKDQLHEASELVKESLTELAKGETASIRNQVAESFGMTKIVEKDEDDEDDSDDSDDEDDDKKKSKESEESDDDSDDEDEDDSDEE